jgi:glutaredoxin
MIEIYGKPDCGYCKRAVVLCETRNLKYNYYQLNEHFTRDELLEMFPDAETFPQIKVNGTAIGGYDQLGSYLEETNYNGTGMTL